MSIKLFENKKPKQEVDLNTFTAAESKLRKSSLEDGTKFKTPSSALSTSKSSEFLSLHLSPVDLDGSRKCDQKKHDKQCFRETKLWSTGCTSKSDGNLVNSVNLELGPVCIPKPSVEKLNGLTMNPKGREKWSHKLDFLLSCIGFAVGLGNVWRFPYLCYKNGGGAFLFPYVVCLLVGGVPVFFMEIALGQYMSLGGYGVWKICPIFKGIGLASTVICFLMNIYYIVILAWDVYYLVMSFSNILPYSHCNNSWNTVRCRQISQTLPFGFSTNQSINASSVNFNISLILTANESANYVDPVVEFWERKILQISPSIEQVGSIVWELALALLFVWALAYFCIWKGVHITGKVVYFTSTFPYIILTILLLRGLTLDGAIDGIIYYIKPDFSKLSDAQVWIDAGTQIFFSYAIAIGAMTALGSYNEFTNNFYKDCIIIATVNSSTSVYAGFVIFSVLGFMAKERSLDISQVAESGPGLAFIVYPKAVSQMPIAPLWAVLFFLMILFLGLGSQFVGVEAFITVIVDLFPSLRKKWNKEIFVAVYVAISFTIGLSMVTNGGMYVFQLFDYYCASGLALLWVCFFECIAVGWIFGAEHFYDAIELMLKHKINPWLKICWKYLTPLITFGIFTFSLVNFQVLTYNRTYKYPWWAQGIGLSLAFVSMIQIPIYFVYVLISTPGSFKERWRKLTTPELYPYQIPDKWPDSFTHRCIGESGQSLITNPQSSNRHIKS